MGPTCACVCAAVSSDVIATAFSDHFTDICVSRSNIFQTSQTCEANYFSFYLCFFFLIVTNKDELDDVVSLCGSQSRSVLIAVDPRTKDFFFFELLVCVDIYAPRNWQCPFCVFGGQEFKPRFVKSKSDITVTYEE